MSSETLDAGPRRATSYDVARRAGTSQSAVSRCFTPGAYVSEEKRALIMRAAEELGYRPNEVARELITGQSQLVGVVISDETGKAYPELLHGLSRAFERLGLRMMLVGLPPHGTSQIDLEPLRAQRMAGAILAADLPEPLVRVLMQDGLELVQYNRSVTTLPLPVVSCDHRQCGLTLADVLTRAGHRSFAFIEGPADSSVGNERLSGVADHIREAGLEPPVRIQGHFTYQGGLEAALRLLDGSTPTPDVMVAANDLMAIGAIDALRYRLGLNVPSQMSVAAFDGIEAGRWIGYDLTTVSQPLARMADATAEMLVSRLRDRFAPVEKRFFAGEIVPGGSARITPL